MVHDTEPDDRDGTAPAQEAEHPPAAWWAGRPDASDGHIGLALTVMALAAVAWFSGPRWTAIIGGAFAVWFLLALAVIHVLGGRGRDAARRAYVATFWWGDYITP